MGSKIPRSDQVVVIAVKHSILGIIYQRTINPNCDRPQGLEELTLNPDDAGRFHRDWVRDYVLSSKMGKPFLQHVLDFTHSNVRGADGQIILNDCLKSLQLASHQGPNEFIAWLANAHWEEISIEQIMPLYWKKTEMENRKHG
jgi:hypothetical protein